MIRSYAALVWLLLLAASAQIKPEDPASLEGQVLDTATGGALRKAAVVLRPIDSPRAGPGSSGYSTSTDDSGNFAMQDIPPGRYRLTASRTGYLNGEYGSRGPGRQGETISVDRAQKLTGLTVKLTPQGVITGRITDRDGDPVAGVLVALFRYRYQQGRKQLQLANGGNTNDLGEYRIAAVPPGKYYLSATFPGDPVLRQTLDRSAAPTSEDFAPTYYPGTLDASTASELTMLAGGQLTADLTLEKVRTARISGRVLKTVDDPRDQWEVQLEARGSVVGSSRAPVGADGKFELRKVPPGSYYLVALETTADRLNSSIRLPVEVGGSDLDDLTLAIGPDTELHGRVRIDGDSTLRLTKIGLVLQPLHNNNIAPPPNVYAAEDGTFHLKPIVPEIYDLSVVGLPDGFYVKSIKSGDTDVQANGLDLTNGPPGDLDVVVSPNAGQVVGLVQDPKTMQPVSGATVVLIPQDQERRNQQRDYRIATTDQSGGFNLTSVVPGEYQVYAWEDVEAGAYFDPEFMQSIESQGQKLSLHEKDQAILQLTVIPATQ